MAKILTEIDRLIRGEMLDARALGRGEVTLDLRVIVRIGLVLGLVYGLFMGLYAACRPANASMTALFATTLKVPLLFLLTFLVTFPSLYVFSTLVGSKCRFHESLGLLTVAMGTNLAVLASLGPITAFFTLSTDSYPFLVLLNILFFALSGLISLGVLNRSIRGLLESRAIDTKKPKAEAEPVAEAEILEIDDEEAARQNRETRGREAMTPRRARPSDPLATVFRVWILIYGIVGAQMGWILRPFIGTPDLPFAWFRPREGSFLTGLGQALAQLFR